MREPKQLYDDRSSSSISRPDPSSDAMPITSEQRGRENEDANDVDSPLHGTVPVEPRLDPQRRRQILSQLSWALQPENRRITLIVNSCGRMDLLEQTLSLLEEHWAL